MVPKVTEVWIPQGNAYWTGRFGRPVEGARVVGEPRLFSNVEIVFDGEGEWNGLCPVAT